MDVNSLNNSENIWTIGKTNYGTQRRYVWGQR